MQPPSFFGLAFLPCAGDLKTSLWKAIEQYHHCIPKGFLAQWADNMKSYVDHASREGQIASAPGCSGTVMRRHCNDALLEYLSEEFGIADVCYDHKPVSEILPWKANFARLQHGMLHCFPDVGSLCYGSSYCSFDHNLTLIELIQEFSGGFSCTQLSIQKLHCRRGGHYWRNVGRNPRLHYHGTSVYVFPRERDSVDERARGSEAKQGGGGDGSDDENAKILTSNDKLVKQLLEEEVFTVIICVYQASDGGSRVERARCYPVVLDIPRDIAEELDVEGIAVRVWRQRRIPQFPFDVFLLSDGQLLELDEAMDGELGPSASKQSKAGAGRWPRTHEMLYTLCGVEWPLTWPTSSLQVCARGSRRCPSWPTRPFPRGGGIGNSWCKTILLSA